MFKIVNINHIMYSSYPTYEEWKHLKREFDIATQESSYPTYEEWKHIRDNSLTVFIKSFLSYL
mgnify:CR=1 FL=1